VRYAKARPFESLPAQSQSSKAIRCPTRHPTSEEADSHERTCITVNKLTDPRTDKAMGLHPWPQCAFENQVFGVSCNSHRLSELAPFFIDLRAE
jgi:hypothetical protein